MEEFWVLPRSVTLDELEAWYEGRLDARDSWRDWLSCMPDGVDGEVSSNGQWHRGDNSLLLLLTGPSGDDDRARIYLRSEPADLPCN